MAYCAVHKATFSDTEPCPHCAATPAKTFDEWYETYPDETEYMVGMRDAFNAGMAAATAARTTLATECPVAETVAIGTGDSHAGSQSHQTAERTPVNSLWPENLTICPRCNRDMLHNKHAVDIWGNIVCLPNVSWKENCEADRQPAPPQPQPDESK